MKCSKHISTMCTIPYFPMYKVGECGCVYSLHSNKIIDPYITPHSYQRIALRLNKRQSHQFIHRLVALTFLEVPLSLDKVLKQNSMVVDHIDSNRLNNHKSNLRWVTNRDNLDMGLQRMREKGLKRYSPLLGSLNHKSKLNENNVSNILHMKGYISAKDLAKHYGYSTTTYIYLIWKRKIWRHVI